MNLNCRRNFTFVLCGLITTMLPVAGIYTPPAAAQDTLTLDSPQCAGMSGFRGHWDRPIPVAEAGARRQVDSVVNVRGQTAIWDGEQPGPLAFDAVQRSLLVRFPGAAETIAAALAEGKVIGKVELVLPYLDEEIWPQGRVDFPSADGYRYRMNWNCDKLYRNHRPNCHAVAHVLRKPWTADPEIGPTYNAAVNGAVYWKRFGASDTTEDRFPAQLGPAEVSSYNPDGRIDVTALATDPAYGATLGERLRVLADCGFVIGKWETYDAGYYNGPYEFTTSTGPRAILIKMPKLVVTFKPGRTDRITLPPGADPANLAATHKAKPLGTPTAAVPSPEEVARLNQRYLARPAWMPEWQYDHVRQLMSLEGAGTKPFYYRLMPGYVINRAIQPLQQAAIEKASKEAGKKVKSVQLPQDEVDYAVYLAWVDWNQGCPPRYWEGHLTAANAVTQWYGFREALPAPTQDLILRTWNAWLMPDRESAATDAERKDFNDTSGRLVHPMVDDPRVGFSAGRQADWKQGHVYYQQTGDWRGNRSFFRSGFTQMMSTANFNSTAVTGALLCGQMIGSERAIEDGRTGLYRWPFRMWTWNGGLGQEYIDHYYWSIALAGNKLFADHSEGPVETMLGWSIVNKSVNDLAQAYHPGLRKLLGPASRTYYEHLLGVQDGVYHILHVLSRNGALCDVDAGVLPALTPSGDYIAATTAEKKRKLGKEEEKLLSEGKPLPPLKLKDPAPITAWGHDYPPHAVAQNSLSGPWADPWMTEWIDEKPLPWYALAEKKVVNDGDLVTTWMGENYGLSSIRQIKQRIHVQGQWRRQAKTATSMRDLGTLDVRIGFNQTQIGNDLPGDITQQGVYRIGQCRNKMILLARPQTDVIAKLSENYRFGDPRNRMGGTLGPQEITSVQCTAALFNYADPGPTWQIFVDGRGVTSLPATARTGQVITIRDGVTYLAFRPLPTADFGRDADVTLEVPGPQTQAYHERTLIQPALFIHVNFYRRARPPAEVDLERMQGKHSGFVVEMGDEAEYGSFARFQAHVRAAKLVAEEQDGAFSATYTSGADALAAKWQPNSSNQGLFVFTINGVDPHEQFKSAQLWQDTTLSQMGTGRLLEKAGAKLECSAPPGSPRPLMVQVFPRQKTSVFTNPVPSWRACRFRSPEGVTIFADGLVCMSQWAVVDGGREIRVRNATVDFNPEDTPKTEDRATVLFVTGTRERPTVTFNGDKVTPKPYTHNGINGWLIPLGKEITSNEVLAERLDAADAKCRGVDH